MIRLSRFFSSLMSCCDCWWLMCVSVSSLWICWIEFYSFLLIDLIFYMKVVLIVSVWEIDGIGCWVCCVFLVNEIEMWLFLVGILELVFLGRRVVESDVEWEMFGFEWILEVLCCVVMMWFFFFLKGCFGVRYGMLFYWLLSSG